MIYKHIDEDKSCDNEGRLCCQGERSSDSQGDPEHQEEDHSREGPGRLPRRLLLLLLLLLMMMTVNAALYKQTLTVT